MKKKYGLLFLVQAVLLGFLIAYIQDKNIENNYIVMRGYVIGLETTVQNPEVFVRFIFFVKNNKEGGMSSIFKSRNSKSKLRS